MSLPIVKITGYDLLMRNIPATLATEECLIVLEDTGKMIHWNPQKYIDMCTNARIDRYTKLINQMNYNETNKVLEQLQQTTSKPTTTYHLSFDAPENPKMGDLWFDNVGGYGGGGASTAYLPDKMAYFYPHFEFTKSDYGIWKIKYEIQPGDTLSEIASAAGSPLEKVLKYNPQIKNPNKIKAYDWINLPTGLIVEPEKFVYEFNQRKELLKNKTVAELRYTSRKEAIDTYSRMILKVDGKHVLCLSCGGFVHTPKIGKYNDRYCENCGCYLPDSMFGKE